MPLKLFSMRELLMLALPVTAVQLGMMAMGVVDTMMVGHLSAEALAGVALGNLYFFLLTLFALGVLMALDPLVAQAVGAHDREAVARDVQRGIVIAALLTVPISLLFLAARPVMVLFGQPPVLVDIASDYAIASIPGVLPYLVFIVLRQTLQAIGHLRALLVTIVLANLLNVGLNWMLIFGHLGFPALGAVGSAWASSAARIAMCLGLLVLSWNDLRESLVPLRREALAWRPLRAMFRLGLPIGFQVTLEGGAFAVIGLLMGWLGPTAMAGHQIAINLASITFMIPLGVAGAAAVLVGRAIGRGDMPAARSRAAQALFCGAAFMVTSSIAFVTIPRVLASAYSGDAAVLRIAAVLIPIAGIFQVFDGVQVVAAGILRGLGDTRTALLVNVIGFWAVGMPISVLLGVRTGSPTGLWWGLVAGLGAVASFLLYFVRRDLRGERTRLRID